MPAHHLPTCPICYATAAFAMVLLAAAILWVRDVLRVRGARRLKPKPWYRSNIKLPRTRADDFTKTT